MSRLLTDLCTLEVLLAAGKDHSRKSYRPLGIASSVMNSLNRSVSRFRYLIQGGRLARGRMNSFRTRTLLKLCRFPRDWDEPGDLHDMTTPTATIKSRGDALGSIR